MGKAQKTVKLGYDIVMAKGVCPRPVQISVWNQQEKFKSVETQPFKYMADALLGLSMIKLNPQLSCPVLDRETCLETVEQAWSAHDPHLELWKRAADRVHALHLQVLHLQDKHIQNFEKQFQSLLNNCMTTAGLEIEPLLQLIDCIEELEEKPNGYLLYNFGLHFSETTTRQLHALYSLLFHLRSIVAVDWNAHVDDPSHEAVKIDSITDYVPKADYIVNDAMLYWQFLNLSHPFVAGRNSDVKIEKLLVEPMKSAFHSGSHNACKLIDCLPKSFIQKLGSDLEQGLYLVQMDWLLGSHAGLLFRIREELYGLREGYEKIFWHDLQNQNVKKAYHLSLCFELDHKAPTVKAA